MLGDDLESNRAVHADMLRLEHLAHSALAQSIQNAVGTEEEVLALPLEKLIGLIRCEPLPIHQITAKRSAIDEDRTAGRAQGLHLEGCQEPVFLEERQELCWAWNGHIAYGSLLFARLITPHRNDRTVISTTGLVCQVHKPVGQQGSRKGSLAQSRLDGAIIDLAMQPVAGNQQPVGGD